MELAAGALGIIVEAAKGSHSKLRQSTPFLPSNAMQSLPPSSVRPSVAVEANHFFPGREAVLAVRHAERMGVDLAVLHGRAVSWPPLLFPGRAPSPSSPFAN